MGICFVGKRKFDEFLSEYIPQQPGNFIDIDTGDVLGKHQGLPFYTPGQGANIGGLPTKYTDKKSHCLLVGTTLWEKIRMTTQLQFVKGQTIRHCFHPP